jgi:hypothetical protein
MTASGKALVPMRGAAGDGGYARRHAVVDRAAQHHADQRQSPNVTKLVPEHDRHDLTNRGPRSEHERPVVRRRTEQPA